MRYSLLIKQLFVVGKSKWILHLFKGKLFSIGSFEIVSNIKKSVPHLDHIIDVGANSGQFTKIATNFYPNAKINAFEPLPNLYPKIKKLFSANKNISTHNLALGNEVGVIKFNKNNYGHISSILEISDENIHYPKQKNDLEQIDVQIKTLDSLALVDKEKNGITLLKLDVQGYELEVLKGAEQSLKNIDYIVIEANLEQLYINQPSLNQMYNYLDSKGYEIKGMLDFNLGNGNKYIEVDLLFSKKK